MRHEDFAISSDFVMSGRRHRCTDVGTRTIVAMRLDGVTPGPFEAGSPPSTLTPDEAGRQGWLRGPPYAIPEVVIDEDNMPACEPWARDGG